MEAEPIRERLRGLGRGELVGFAVLAVIVVAGAGLWYVRSLPHPIRVQGLASAGGPAAAPAASASPTASPAVVIVDVAGWVHHPGVYELHQGDRIIDAIEAAGGAKSGADLTSINLAAVLTDAQQILVTKKGAAPPAAGGSTTGAGVPPGAGPAGALININTATLDELETLPGIGPALGQRIIDYREEHGPFKSVDELLNVSGIGDSRLADIRSKVTV